MQLEQLRQKLKELRTEREAITMEKGLVARENNDLRENFAYDYWCEKEHVITTQIHKLMEEIDGIARKNKPATSRKLLKSKPEIKIKDLPKKKWL